MKKKLNEKVAKMLVKKLDDDALRAVDGGTLTVGAPGPGICRTCGLLVTTEV